MTPQRPLTNLDRPSNYPTPTGTRSLLVAFALLAVIPMMLWALENPVTAAVLAVVTLGGAALVHAVDRTRWTGGRYARVHVPGTDVDVEVSVIRPSRGR